MCRQEHAAGQQDAHGGQHPGRVSDDEYSEDAAQPSEDVPPEMFIIVNHLKQHVLGETDGDCRSCGELQEKNGELRAAGVSLPPAPAWSEFTGLAGLRAALERTTEEERASTSRSSGRSRASAVSTRR